MIFPLTCLGALVTIGGLAISHAAEDYSTWSYSAELILNTSPSGANITNTLGQFPLLLRLKNSNFTFSQAKGQGQDFRVTDTQGKLLPYEIERWDSTHAQAEIWIRTDSLLGNAADQKLLVYWGKWTALDSSKNKGVFTQGFSQVWHLGEKASDSRVNSVSGGLPAIPMRYDGNESTEGIIGKADSLDGESLGDYLDLGDGYQDYAQGFTFSVWIYPTAVKKYCQILHLGNGEYSNNILVNRLDSSNDMAFNIYKLTVPNEIKMKQAWVLNQWRYISVTVSGTQVKFYRDGILDSTKTLANPIDSLRRTMNYLGRSGWMADAYYQGKLDEPQLSKVTRSADWIKLSYLNQKSDQNWMTLKPKIPCAAKFVAPKDTLVNEGEHLTLIGSADCATKVSWSSIAGPTPRIIDPESKELSINLPRISGDTTLVYRFTAIYAESTSQRNITIRIKENIPDPQFTLPLRLNWNGQDTVSLEPNISNLKAIQASRDSVLHWNWSVIGLMGPEGQPADTAWRTPTLLLLSAPAGNLEIRLCLDNKGPTICKSTTILVTGGTTAVKALKTLKALKPIKGLKILGFKESLTDLLDQESSSPDALGRRHLPPMKKVPRL